MNVSNLRTKFQIQVYRYFNEDPDEQFIKGGSIVRLLHSEKGGFLHSDDKDFTNDGIAEVYLWNFKGKQTDIESISSNSLFQIEIAGPLKESDADLLPTVDDKESAPIDVNDRVGKVYSYSEQSGIG